VPFEAGATTLRGCPGSKKGKGVIMKTSVLASVLLSTLFYTTVLLTTFVMPLVLAAGDVSGKPAATRDAEVWDRADAPAKMEARRDLRLQQTDPPVSGAAAKPAPIDKSGPDATMVKPGKLRAKTIKV
jgi:hypothetical protein